MRFELSDEQRGFARSLHDLLDGAEVPRTVRVWADGDPDPGLKVWRRLADLGVTGLLVPEAAGGLGASPVDLVVAFEALGNHAVPGPWVESVAFLPVLLHGGPDEHVGAPQDTVVGADAVLAGVADGTEVATVASPPVTPLALDADVATRRYLLEGEVLRLGTPTTLKRSVDPARRLFGLDASQTLGSLHRHAASTAFDTAALACAAQLLGAGERLLAEAVSYARSRRQFGRAVGEYQALKHALADVRVGLDFARPLLYGAALSLGSDSHDAGRDVSAAKVAAADASYRAARTALQVHGAIGYTAEYDLGLWILKVRALVAAWGTTSWHRARVLEAVTAAAPLDTREV